MILNHFILVYDIHTFGPRLFNKISTYLNSDVVYVSYKSECYPLAKTSQKITAGLILKIINIFRTIEFPKTITQNGNKVQILSYMPRTVLFAKIASIAIYCISDYGRHASNLFDITFNPCALRYNQYRALAELSGSLQKSKGSYVCCCPLLVTFDALYHSWPMQYKQEIHLISNSMGDICPSIIASVGVLHGKHFDRFELVHEFIKFLYPQSHKY